MFGHKIERRQTRVATIVVALALLFIGCFSSVSVAKAATIEELQVMIATLMAQIAAMQAAGTPGVHATSTNPLHVGVTITTTDTIRVRSQAGVRAPFLGTQSAGVQGVVVDGPIVADGYNWFKVDYATGTDGWNAGPWLRAATDLPDLKGTYVGYMDGKMFITTENITRADALANCKLNASSNSGSVVRCTWRGVEIFVSTTTKSTPRIIEAMGPADASFVNATIVYGMPTTGMPVVTGPANIGSINWGDGTAAEAVFELISGTQKTVHRKHTYADNGSYTITATGLDGKTDTKTVSISKLPQPKPVVTGLYRGYKGGRLFIETKDIAKADAAANCQTNVTANPTSSYRCEWNGRVIFATGIIYENPDMPVRVLAVTNDKNPLVSGTASGTATVDFAIVNLAGAEVYRSNGNPVADGKWSSEKTTVDLTTGKYTAIAYVNNTEVARRDFAIQLSDTIVGTTTPNRNAFGCARAISGGTFANGVVACYGMWDDGDSFGGDNNMCGNYGEGKIGCQIKTKLCTSGNAKATAYYAGTDLTATRLNTVSARLHTTSEMAKLAVKGLWEYSCTPAPVTPAASSSASGVVLGASTDVYAEIANTLESIKAAIAALK